jgi:hypothetical protein
MNKIPSININLNNNKNQNRINKKENLKKSDSNNNSIKASINHLDNNINDISQKSENIKISKNNEVNNEVNNEAFINYYFVEYQNKIFRDTMEDFHDYKNLSFNNFAMMRSIIDIIV